MFRSFTVAFMLSGLLLSACGNNSGDGTAAAVTNARAKEAPAALRNAIQAASEEKGENRTQYVGKIDGTNAYLAVVDSAPRSSPTPATARPWPSTSKVRARGRR